MEYGFTKDRLLSMSAEDILKEVQDFMERELKKFPEERFNALQKASVVLIATNFAGTDFSTMPFHARRAVLTNLIMPKLHRYDPLGDLPDLVERVTDAAWEIAVPADPAKIIPLWKMQMLPLERMSKEDCEKGIFLEEHWLGMQEAVNTNNYPKAQGQTGTGQQEVSQLMPGAPSSAEKPFSPEERMKMLEALKQHVYASYDGYTPEELKEIIYNNMKRISINVGGKIIEVEISLDMISPDGKHIVIPADKNPAKREITVTVPPEYIAMFDPDGPAQKSGRTGIGHGPWAITIPTPDGSEINILLTEDMIGANGEYITLPPGTLPSGMSKSGQRERIYITPSLLDAAKKSRDQKEKEERQKAAPPAAEPAPAAEPQPN
jgi:hypothetical protein